MIECCRQLAELDRRRSQCAVRLHDERSIPQLASESEKALPESTRGSQVCSKDEEQAERPQHAIRFSGCTERLGQYSGALVHLLDFLSRESFRCHERGTEDHPKRQLLSGSIRGFRKRADSSEPATSERCCLVMRELKARVLGSSVEVRHGSR